MNEKPRERSENTNKDCPRLGQLLIAGGACVPQEVNVAAQLSKIISLRIGEFLVESGALSARLLQSVVNSQSLVRSGHLEPGEAVERIKIATAADKKIRKMTRG